MRTVSELMTPNPLCVPPDAPIAECARLISRNRIRHLLVTDPRGGLEGLVTEYDVFRCGGLVGAEDELWISFAPDEPAKQARDLAIPVALVSRTSDRLAALFQQWRATAQDVVVVVDGVGRVVGILTEHDAVRLAAQLLPRESRVVAGATSKMVAIERGEPATRALSLMEEHAIRHVIILDEGVLWGVVSYRDLVADDIPSGREVPVDHVVRALDTRSVPDGTSLRVAAAEMAEARIGCLPIVTPDKRPLGVLTRTDLIAALAEILASDVEDRD